MILEYKKRLGDSNASVQDKKMLALLDFDLRNAINKVSEKNIKGKATSKVVHQLKI
jgi:hypothetical protein